jgi:hypothetical protein
MDQIFPHYQTIDLNLDACRWELARIYYGNVFWWLLLGNFIMPSCVLIRRETFLKANGFNPSYPVAEDTELFLRLSKTRDFMFVDLPLSGYRKAEAGSLTKDPKPLMEYAIKALVENCLNDAACYQKFKNRINYGLSQVYGRLSYYYLSELMPREAFSGVLKSLRYYPLNKRAWMCCAGSLMPKGALALATKVKRRWIKNLST